MGEYQNNIYNTRDGHFIFMPVGTPEVHIEPSWVKAVRTMFKKVKKFDCSGIIRYANKTGQGMAWWIDGRHGHTLQTIVKWSKRKKWLSD